MGETPNRPWLVRMGVKECYGRADVLVSKRGQPTGLRCRVVFIKVRTDCLNEQDVSQSRDNRFRAGAVQVQFLQDVYDGRPQLGSCLYLLPFHMDQRGKDREKRLHRTVLELHPSTKELGDGSGASSGKCSSLVRSTALNQIEKILDRRCACVPHQVGAAARHNHEISRRQLHRHHTFDFQPTRSVDDYVKNGAFTRYTKTPRRVKLRQKVEAPAQADRAKQIGE